MDGETKSLNELLAISRRQQHIVKNLVSVHGCALDVYYLLVPSLAAWWIKCTKPPKACQPMRPPFAPHSKNSKFSIFVEKSKQVLDNPVYARPPKRSIPHRWLPFSIRFEQPVDKIYRHLILVPLHILEVNKYQDRVFVLLKRCCQRNTHTGHAEVFNLPQVLVILTNLHQQTILNSRVAAFSC